MQDHSPSETTAFPPAFAAYRGAEANDPELAHIHPLLRHLAVPIDQVLLDPGNVNRHPPEQLEVLKGMLRTFGQRAPLITRESTGVLEAGEGAGHYWCGSRSQSSVWQIAKPTKSADHPTMKPIELLARAIGNSSVRGDIVFDGFGGSGQTLFAANGLGRRARLVELSPGFCDVIARRARELGLEVVVDRPGVGRIPWGEALAA